MRNTSFYLNPAACKDTTLKVVPLLNRRGHDRSIQVFIIRKLEGELARGNGFWTSRGFYRTKGGGGYGWHESYSFDSGLEVRLIFMLRRGRGAQLPTIKRWIFPFKEEYIHEAWAPNENFMRAVLDFSKKVRLLKRKNYSEYSVDFRDVIREYLGVYLDMETLEVGGNERTQGGDTDPQQAGGEGHKRGDEQPAKGEEANPGGDASCVDESDTEAEETQEIGD